MAEKIAMTPDREIMWEIHDVGDGKLLLPEEADDRTVSALLKRPDEVMRENKFIASGSMADVYEVNSGVQALRLVVSGVFNILQFTRRPFSEDMQLGWLRSNIMIAQALISEPRTVGEGLRVLSPDYLGAYISAEHSLFLMNNCMIGRRRGSHKSDRDKALAREASDGLSELVERTYGERYHVRPDPSATDILIGIGDVVRVDANGGFNLAF